MKNLYFRISTRPCFIHIGKTQTSNPELLNFPPPCQRFLPTQRTLFLSLFLSFIKQWWRSWGEWGGQMWKGTNLSLARTHTNISPPNPYASWPITLLRKIHSRCWRSSPAKKKYTAPPYTLAVPAYPIALGLTPPDVTVLRDESRKPRFVF